MVLDPSHNPSMNFLNITKIWSNEFIFANENTRNWYIYT